MKQTCILVLGMHRSGTSALTGTLSLLDIYLGSELMKPNFDNLKGYFENNIIYQVNENLLSQINSSWNDVFYNENKLEDIQQTDELKNTILKEFGSYTTFAIKDPRLIFLFPIYKQVLEELNIDIKIIMPYRNPIEVATSLNTRDKMSIEEGMLLWAYHFLLAEKFSRAYPRVFVEFDELISDSKKVIDTISLKLDMDLTQKYEENQQLIKEFLEPDLKHHNISGDNLSHDIPKVVKEVLAIKDNFNHEDMTQIFDSLREEVFGYQKLFYNSSFITSYNKLKSMNETLTQVNNKLSKILAQTHHEFIQKNDELTQNHYELSQTLTQKTLELIQKKDELTQKNDELTQKNDELTQKNDELTQSHYELSQTLTQKNDALAISNSEIQNLKEELAALYASKSWKITGPLRKLMRVFK